MNIKMMVKMLMYLWKRMNNIKILLVYLNKNHETDFKGIDDFDAQNDNNKENKRRGSVDNSFEPFKLSKQDRISRIGSKLSQRPSVEDMRMRGLLYEHPSISKSLVEKK
eukprot:395368_1